MHGENQASTALREHLTEPGCALPLIHLPGLDRLELTAATPAQTPRRARDCHNGYAALLPDVSRGLEQLRSARAQRALLRQLRAEAAPMSGIIIGEETEQPTPDQGDDQHHRGRCETGFARLGSGPDHSRNGARRNWASHDENDRRHNLRAREQGISTHRGATSLSNTPLLVPVC
jgi:hypothetical protein